ncbi:hypothetical protein LX32DRAFT_699066 [Colletotrichum zoysiae]|uniref:Uncharacterized protein n=1 Tax=Colletotrichum zoysiae TaxID=1216348 RepID=A0AAD9LU02_9PEZI|nr:hypothetical protein LX32DRAFT_699066 [Colletotrichum zoysiae]
MFSFDRAIFGPLSSLPCFSLFNLNLNVSLHRQVDVPNEPAETATRWADLEAELNTLKKEVITLEKEIRTVRSHLQQKRHKAHQKRGTRGDYRISKAQAPRRLYTQLDSREDPQSPDEFSDDRDGGFFSPSQTACSTTTPTVDISKMNFPIVSEGPSKPLGS